MDPNAGTIVPVNLAMDLLVLRTTTPVLPCEDSESSSEASTTEVRACPLVVHQTSDGGVPDGSSKLLALQKSSEPEGSTGSTEAGYCGNVYSQRCLTIDEGEARIERLLDVLDRLVDSRFSGAAQMSSDELAPRHAGNAFTQEIYDIFREDEKICVVHSYYERNLGDPAIVCWFCLLASPPSSASSTFHLDPDGTFQQHTERIRQDVLYSLRLLAAELTLGLLFLHDRGIVHLAIRPENILVTLSGHIQIGNFGTAIALPRLLPGLLDLSDMGSVYASSSTVTTLLSGFGSGTQHFGLAVLTPEETIETTKYSAPELLERDDQGRIVFGVKADWWSLGSMLRELGYDTGDRGLSPSENQEDGCFNEFIRKLLAKEPQHRLAGTAVQEHGFLNFELGTWDEILSRSHPPCPGITSRSGARADTPSSPDSSITPAAVHFSYLRTVEAGSSALPCRIRELISTTDLDEDGQWSDIQPFPSTASLYQSSEVNQVSEGRIESQNQSPSDSTLELDGLHSLWVEDTDQGEDDGVIMIRMPHLSTDCSRTVPYLSCERHGDRDDWVHMTVDEIVALSLLQAGDADKPGITGDTQRYKLRNRRRLDKARGIVKSSGRVVKHVSRYIYTAVLCQ